MAKKKQKANNKVAAATDNKQEKVTKKSIVDYLKQAAHDWLNRYTKKYSLVALLVIVGIYTLDNHWTAIDPVSFLAYILIVLVAPYMTDANQKSEKILYVLFLCIICVAAYLTNILVDHECTICVLSLPELVKKYVLPEPGDERLDAWQLFTHDKHTPQTCANCLIILSKTARLAGAGLVPGFLKNLDEDTFDTLDDLLDITNTTTHHAEDCSTDDEASSCPAIENPDLLSPAEFREMDEWYVAIRQHTAPKRAFQKFVAALASDVNSEIGNELLSNMTHDFLCYPTSRWNGPKPSEFLNNLKTPRFTGEEEVRGDGPMKIEFEKLVAIMRGDMMRSLRPDVCGMIRLLSMIEPDNTVLTTEMSAANVAPIANETTLKGHDVGWTFPGLFVARTDEDKDVDGSAAGVTETLISLYRRIPMVDDGKWFETRQEYLAFFRWLIEHKLQEEYYFPRWLSRVNGTDGADKLMDEIADLVADQFRFRGDRQRIFEPASDQTLADRAFYGVGVKSLTRIKLPGDASYGYLVNPLEYHETLAEREFFRNKVMPSEENLLRMAEAAWGSPVKDISTLRDRVVQIDYMIASHWQYRDFFEPNGAILYLDAEKRTPMGIWVSCREQMVLPNEVFWENAKFIYRSTEIVVAAMMHVGVYHLGWANRVEVAIRQTLPPTHGLRMLMKPYTHGTSAVNWNAYQMLVLDDSILARASGLTSRARGYAWGHFVKHADMVSTIPQTLEAKDLEGVSNLTTTLPYFTQGTRLWEIHREYVESFVNFLYNDTSLVEDDALHRFWHHINTQGRHLCPCICDMEASTFF